MVIKKLQNRLLVITIFLLIEHLVYIIKGITADNHFDCQPLSVPRPGIEPGWIAPLVFETSASTDSAIWACVSDFDGAKVVIFFVSDKD